MANESITTTPVTKKSLQNTLRTIDSSSRIDIFFTWISFHFLYWLRLLFFFQTSARPFVKARDFFTFSISLLGLPTVRQLSDMTVCKYEAFPERKCFDRLCERCGTMVITEWYEPLVSIYNNKHVVQFNQWETINEKYEDKASNLLVNKWHLATCSPLISIVSLFGMTLELASKNCCIFGVHSFLSCLVFDIFFTWISFHFLYWLRLLFTSHKEISTKHSENN
jgi:hypothetical protein